MNLYVICIVLSIKYNNTYILILYRSIKRKALPMQKAIAAPTQSYEHQSGRHSECSRIAIISETMDFCFQNWSDEYR